MKVGYHRLTQEDIVEFRTLVSSTVKEIRDVSDLKEELDGQGYLSTACCQAMFEVFAYQIEENKKLLHTLATLANSIAQSAQTLIDLEHDATEQQNQLNVALSDLQHHYFLLRDQNDELKTRVLSVTQANRQLQKQRDDLQANYDKIHQQMNQADLCFHEQNRLLKERLQSAFDQRENLPSFSAFEETQDSLHSAFANQITKIKNQLDEEKQKNQLLQQQLELAELNLKEFYQKYKALIKKQGKTQKKPMKSAISSQISCDESKLLQRNNLKSELASHNQAVDLFQEQKSEYLERSHEQFESYQEGKSDIVDLAFEMIQSSTKTDYQAEKILQEQIQEIKGSKEGKQGLDLCKAITKTSLASQSFCPDMNIPKGQESNCQNEMNLENISRGKRRLWMKSMEKLIKHQEKQLNRINTEIQLKVQKKIRNTLVSPDNTQKQKFKNKILSKKAAFIKKQEMNKEKNKLGFQKKKLQ